MAAQAGVLEGAKARDLPRDGRQTAEESRDAQVLVNVRPVDALAVPEELEVSVQGTTGLNAVAGITTISLTAVK